MAAERLPARARPHAPAATTRRTTSRCSRTSNTVAAVRGRAARASGRGPRSGSSPRCVIEPHPEPAAAGAPRSCRTSASCCQPNDRRPGRRGSSSPSPTTGVEVVVEGLPVEIQLPARAADAAAERGRRAGRAEPDRRHPGRAVRGRRRTTRFEVVLRELDPSSLIRVHLRVRLTEEHEVVDRARRADLDRAVPLQRAAVPRRARPRLPALPDAERRAHRARARRWSGPGTRSRAGWASTGTGADHRAHPRPRSHPRPDQAARRSGSPTPTAAAGLRVRAGGPGPAGVGLADAGRHPRPVRAASGRAAGRRRDRGRTTSPWPRSRST